MKLKGLCIRNENNDSKKANKQKANLRLNLYLAIPALNISPIALHELTVNEVIIKINIAIQLVPPLSFQNFAAVFSNEFI